MRAGRIPGCVQRGFLCCFDFFFNFMINEPNNDNTGCNQGVVASADIRVAEDNKSRDEEARELSPEIFQKIESVDTEGDW